MWRKIFASLNVLTVLWSVFSIAVVILNWLGVLPYYNIYLKEKSGITPITFMFPGNQMRLGAEFETPVDMSEIENVVWTLKESSGKEYEQFPQISPEITLHPDYSGILNITVKAKLRGQKDERIGSRSIQIVQKQPQQLSLHDGGLFYMPPDWQDVDSSTVQVYLGDAKWVPASATVKAPNQLKLALRGGDFPIWDGKAYLRFKTSDDTTTTYNYEALMTLDPSINPNR